MSKVLRSLLSYLVLTVMLLTLALPFASAQQASSSQLPRPFVHPLLLSSKFWSAGGLALEGSGFEPKLPPLVKKVVDGEHYARILVVMVPSVEVAEAVAKAASGPVSPVMPVGKYYIVSAWVKRSDVAKLVNIKGVVALLPDVRIDSFIIKETEWRQNMASAEGLAKKFSPAVMERVRSIEIAGKSIEQVLAEEVEPQLKPHYTVNITKAIDVWLKYGIYGQNVTIAIIDTGVDYASPGLGLEAIARDEQGLPMILDADELGLVLTPVVAEKVNDTHIFVNVSQLYIFFPGGDTAYIIKTSTGFVNLVYSGIYLEYQLPSYWNVSGLSFCSAKFGEAVRILYTPLDILMFTVPVLVVDSNCDNVFDTVYVDLSTAWYYVGTALKNVSLAYMPPVPEKPDYSFADEKPVRYGSEIAAADLDGDGYYDFSVGTLAGAVNDAYWVILYKKSGDLDKVMAGASEGEAVTVYGLWDMWAWDYGEAVWPGLDPEGDYVTLLYDFHSHGTFCANTAAGRPFPAYIGYGANGLGLITGQAPEAKIGAATALWLGSVGVAFYYFSGFDLETPYGTVIYLPSPSTDEWVAFSGTMFFWNYTGRHQADMTSNSWGSSGWALWGWASGYDPVSAIVDYTSYVSGTVHFIAVGNGGPGWGTIAVPGASTLGVGVGAATEFTYRPFYGYMFGGNREVVSWSNRGPTESGNVKPDVVAIGSFAWAVGRPWDSLEWGVLTGAYAYDLFGGTSQATPMTAGVAALVVSAFKQMGVARVSFWMLKTVLMSTASDMGFDPFSQGAGFVNALKAVESVLESKSLLAYAPVVSPIYGFSNETKIVVEGMAGSVEKVTIKLMGPDGLYRVKPVTFEKVGDLSLCDAAIMFVNCTAKGFILDFGRLSYNDLVAIAMFDPSRLVGYDLFTIDIAFPYQYLEASGREANRTLMIRYADFELWYWIDLNNDGVIQLNETGRLQYDLRQANTFHLQIAKLADQLAEIEKLVKSYWHVDTANKTKALLLVFRIFGNEWSGTGSVPVEFTARVRLYKVVPWSLVLSPGLVKVSDGEADLSVLVTVPRKPGVYEGYLLVKSIESGEEIRIPVVVTSVADASRGLTLTSVGECTSLYCNTMVTGAFDWSWRYESGDWRVFKVYVAPHGHSRLIGFYVKVEWPVNGDTNYATDVDAAVFGPWIYALIYNTDTHESILYYVDGLELAAELVYPYGEFWDTYGPGKLMLVAPVAMGMESSGVLLTVVVRSVNYDGLALEEPLKITVKPLWAYEVTLPLYTREMHRLIIVGPSEASIERASLLEVIEFTGDGRVLGNLTADEAGLTVSMYTRSFGFGANSISLLNVMVSGGNSSSFYVLSVGATTSVPVFSVGGDESGLMYASATIPVWIYYPAYGPR